MLVSQSPQIDMQLQGSDKTPPTKKDQPPLGVVWTFGGSWVYFATIPNGLLLPVSHSCPHLPVAHFHLHIYHEPVG